MQAIMQHLPLIVVAVIVATALFMVSRGASETRARVDALAAEVAQAQHAAQQQQHQIMQASKKRVPTAAPAADDNDGADDGDEPDEGGSSDDEF